MKKILFLCFLIVSLITSCTITEENIWFVKDATSCAEAWQGENWVTDQFEINAKTWLETQGVTVLASEYDPAGTTPEACNACFCLSGGVYRIQADAEFTDIMIAEGFALE